MNDKDELEVTNLNTDEEMGQSGLNVEEDLQQSEEGFLKKHRFMVGVLTGMLAMVVVTLVGMQLITMTGQLFVLGAKGVTKVENTPLLDEKTVAKLDEIYSYMNIYYYEDYEIEDIQKALCDGLVKGLKDPYSVYYTQEEYLDAQINTSGVFCGIGAGLVQDKNTMQVTISKVYRGTPAEEAGLLDGDKILSVDGIDATSMELDALVREIRGEEGTTTHMVILREETQETLEFDVERRNVELPSVEGEMIDDTIGYIRLTGFQDKTDEQFHAMVEKLNKEGMKGLVIDLRDNPGGMLSSVINIMDEILPEGLITYVEDPYGNRQEYKSDAACIDIPMVVLVNENSASASEIFAGAIKDYEYATLVGKKTFGKGIVQTIIRLSDGDALKLTTSKYYTPKGNYIHGVGIEPDAEIDYEYSGPEEAPYEKEYDSQYLQALSILQQKMAGEE